MNRRFTAGHWRVALLAAVLLAGSCSSSGSAIPSRSGPADEPAEAAESEIDSAGGTVSSDRASASGDVPGSGVDGIVISAGFERVVVRGAEAGSTVLIQPPENEGTGQRELSVDRNGTAVALNVRSGPAMVSVTTGSQVVATKMLTVPDQTPPDQSHYDEQSLQPGFNYVETRDGTLLSAFVTLPGTGEPAAGPYPTLVEYSGYSPSDPDAVDPARLTLPLLGYALVQVNVRGTGCSGGVYDTFAEIERLDGYDVIETVAAQPWSDGVGMWGVSYPGIMQLHVGASQPPSLSAIAPLSVIGTTDETMYPGGIFNSGFGRNWTERVGESAEALGQEWTRTRIDSGDQTCASNQTLRVHNPDLIETIVAAPYATDFSRSRSPESFVDRIDVPVFLAGAWQDEQTGANFTNLLDDFDRADPLRVILYNGLHIDPLGPDVLAPLLDFYSLYVARRAPVASPLVDLVVGAGTSSFFGASLDVPVSPYVGLSYEEALAEYEADDPIRVLYEVGADRPNLPVARFEENFTRWPIPETEALTFELTAAGELVDIAGTQVLSAEETVVGSFTTDPSEGSVLTIEPGAREDAIWRSTPGWDWPVAEPGRHVRFETAPLAEGLVLTGNAVAKLRVKLRNGEPDADIEITLSDRAPDGSETYIQSGWLRLSRRSLRPDNEGLNLRISNTEDGIAPLAAGETVEAAVVTQAFAHVLRSGHRVVLTIDTPGASRAEWAFDTIPEAIDVAVLTGSTISLPTLPASSLTVAIPPAAPPCGALRGQPCRRP